jgi:hypothetical protein
VFRHTAFFMYREDTTPEQGVEMLKGLAYMRFECSTVVALDYGFDLFGGSAPLRTTKPWDRTPRWRAGEVGPPCNYDVALMLDFANRAGNDAYNDDQTHHDVAEYNASICRGELTARVDWEYDGDPLISPGHVRHSAMFLWADDATDEAKEEALSEVGTLESAPGVESLTIGRNAGKLATDFDWIVDIHVADKAAAKNLIEGDPYAEVMKKLIPVTKYEWTARMSHVMRGI